jgi:hypothetical protein
MVCNVGHVDRVVRALSAIVVIALTLLFVPTATPKIILLTISVLLLLSAWFGVCFIYRILGMSSAKPHPQPQ